jgi:Uma2 family endonuclease
VFATLDPSWIRPLRREEYDRLVAAGTFEGERVELLHGMVVRMGPKGPPHDGVLGRVQLALYRALDPRAFVRVQCAFAASDGSEPEPDLAIVPPGDYVKAHPTEAWLVVEVSDSSLPKDRAVKGPLYAASGVPEYWIVNLVDQVIEVYTEPKDGLYAKTSVRRASEALTLVRFPDVTLSVADLLA